MFAAPSTAAKEAAKRQRDSVLEEAIKVQLAKTPEPGAKQTTHAPAPLVSVKQVFQVFQPDRRGFREVLYLDEDDRPMTALVRKDKPYELVSIEVGW